MIEWLSGHFLSRSSSGIIVDVNGVGYGVEMTLSDLCCLPVVGGRIILWTYTHIREDAMRLFGFFDQEERKVFEILISLSGIGPKVAMAMLSTLKVEIIRQAVIQEKSSVFEIVPGIGKRLAEKLLVELKPKLPKLKSASSGGVLSDGTVKWGLKDFPQLAAEDAQTINDEDHSLEVFEDLKSALENFGFKSKAVLTVVTKLRQEASERDLQLLLRKALKQLVGVAQKESIEKNAKEMGDEGDEEKIHEQLF